MLHLLRSERESLPSLVETIDEQVGESKQSQRPMDMRRVEILTRLLELLAEQSPSSVGVLQSTIVSMFTNTGFTNLPAFFYMPEEVDVGCTCGPSEPLLSAIEASVDDRLMVTIEPFEAMMELIPSFELARLLDAYTDYVQAMEVAWQVTALEKLGETPLRGDAAPRIKSADGIAVWNEFAYVADAVQHVIFRVNILTDEIMCFCGMRGKQGLYDGPREVSKFNSPSGLAINESTSTLYVCDTGNNSIRTVSLPSGVVQTLPLTPSDPEVKLESPVGICIVYGEYEYEKENSEEEEEAEDDVDTLNSENARAAVDYDDEDDDGIGRPLLEGITEEDEEYGLDSRRQSLSWAEGGGTRGQQSKHANTKYALGTGDVQPGNALAKNPHSRVSRRTSGFMAVYTSRRASGYLSSHNSRRTSTGFASLSSLSSRRTSTHFSMTPGESAKDSLRECTEEDDEMGYSLAVTGDHCVYLIKPEKGEMIVLAGSPTEYGYRDVDKGKDARFSSLKGITCIRNSLFLADHWNNAIRCINLKNRAVDTVMDFQPCGPIALTVSSSGSVYVLDSEYISVCNILKICSSQCSTRDAEGALGTTMFQLIQDSIGRARGALSNRSSIDLTSSFVDSLALRGSARQSRRGSTDTDATRSYNPSRRSSKGGTGEDEPYPPEHTSASRRASRRMEKVAGSISNLGPRLRQNRSEGQHLLFPPQQHKGGIGGRSSLAPPGSIPIPIKNLGAQSQRHSRVDVSESGAPAGLPVVPKALRSLVPGASLHPALIQMTLRSRGEPEARSVSALTGSQFHVSVVSSVDDLVDDAEEGPEFFSFLNPKHETPWKRIPIGTLQYVYQEATGQCSANTPLALAYWDAADSDATTGLGIRNKQQLLVGSAEWPSVLKVLPPRKAAPQENGRFRAVAVDSDRVVMADCDSNQIFVVNHTKRTKDKIAGCGKAGYLDGPLDVCRMNQPTSVALDPTTHYIYVADSGNHRIRCIDLSTGFMRTVCGNGVKGNRDGNEVRLQSLDSPFDVHFMLPCHLLISCADNSIRRLDLKAGQLETVLVGS